MPIIQILVLTVVFLSAGFTVSASENTVSQQIQLTNMEVNKTEAYQKYLADHSSKTAEIELLIGLVEASGLRFERNGKTYTGPKAARHLNNKLKLFRNQIVSTEYFIEEVASYSKTTGKNYFVLMPDGTRYSMKDVLKSELSRIREALEHSNFEQNTADSAP